MNKQEIVYFVLYAAKTVVVVQVILIVAMVAVVAVATVATVATVVTVVTVVIVPPYLVLLPNLRYVYIHNRMHHPPKLFVN